MSDKERAAFEAWCATDNIKTWKAECDGNELQYYQYADVDKFFYGWKASAERYQSRIAELEEEVVRLKAATGINLTAAVDAAMIETRNIFPPLTRKECELLIKAAMKGGA